MSSESKVEKIDEPMVQDMDSSIDMPQGHIGEFHDSPVELKIVLGFPEIFEDGYEILPGQQSLHALSCLSPVSFHVRNEYSEKSRNDDKVTLTTYEGTNLCRRVDSWSSGHYSVILFFKDETYTDSPYNEQNIVTVLNDLANDAYQRKFKCKRSWMQRCKVVARAINVFACRR